MGGCFVPGCSSDNKENVCHLFTPNKKVGELWVNILKQVRSDKLFNPRNKNNCVCQKHFEEKFLVKVDKFTVAGKTVEIPRERWKLLEDAVPTLYKELPASLQPRLPSKRRILNRGGLESPAKKRRKVLGDVNRNSSITPSGNVAKEDLPTSSVPLVCEDVHPNAVEAITATNCVDWWRQEGHKYKQWQLVCNEGRVCLYLVSIGSGGLPYVDKTIMVRKLHAHEFTH